MLNNNHKNSSCGFSEQLVSYLYNESEEAEKIEFEAHLKNCSDCADEFADFQGVHFSISEWKATDFVNLETPVIEIPYEKTAETIVVSDVSGSWFGGLRNLFSLSPAWSAATAGFAVLAIVAGWAIFTFNSGQDNDIADRGNKNPTKIDVSPTVQTSNVQTNSNRSDNNSKQPDNYKPTQPDILVTKDTNSNKNGVTTVSDKQRQTQKTNSSDKTTPVPKNNGAKNNKKPDTKQETPSLSPYEDEEDDTLRLADLFEEIDTDE